MFRRLGDAGSVGQDILLATPSMSLETRGKNMIRFRFPMTSVLGREVADEGSLRVGVSGIQNLGR